MASDTNKDAEHCTSGSTGVIIELDHTSPTNGPPSSPSSRYSEFSEAQRICIVLLCALAGFFSPFSAFTYFPALDSLEKDLHVSLQLLNISITMYLVVQGIVPAFFGDLADQIGRRPVYLTVLILYFAACIGLALQRSYAGLLILRMLQSAGSSGTIALGTMVVADLAPPHSRGKYIGAMLSGPNTGPSLGPVVGGILADRAGWPWIFWMLTIMGAVCLLGFTILFPETCRNVVGNGSKSPQKWNKPLLSFFCPSNQERRATVPGLSRIPNPFKCIVIMKSRENSLILASNALFYMNYSSMQAALAPLVIEYYDLSSLDSGLCYIAYGVATVLSSFAVGKMLDFDYRLTARQVGIRIDRVSGDDIKQFPIEKARLRSIWYFIISAALATMGFGWGVQKKVHLSFPLVMQFICGVAYTGIFNICLTLIVDLNPDKSGLASVALSFTRCAGAAVQVAVLQLLLQSVGPGGTFTLFGMLSLVSIPMLWIVRAKGAKWRKQEADR